jgi:hypothetical protein
MKKSNAEASEAIRAHYEKHFGSKTPEIVDLLLPGYNGSVAGQHDTGSTHWTEEEFFDHIDEGWRKKGYMK